MIKRPEVDFVAVTCDPCDKPKMVEQAAAAGKPIFLNKPACASLDGARRIAAAVKKHQLFQGSLGEGASAVRVPLQ